MKMVKRFLLLLLVFVFSIALLSCNSPEDSGETNPPTGEEPGDTVDPGFIVGNQNNTTVGVVTDNTTETGGTTTFTVKLASQPSSDVVIPVVSSDTSEGTVSPSSLTFTSENWNADQTVTVTGADDDLKDGNQSYQVKLGKTTSADPNYNDLDVGTVSIANIDDDTAGFFVGAVSGNTTEAGDKATFTVRLNSQPAADVTIGIASSDTEEGTVSPASLTYTSRNWNANQTVTVTGIADEVADGNQSFIIVLAAAGSSDTNYDGLDPADVTVVNTDTYSTEVVVGSISGSTTEAGGKATFGVKLSSQPTAAVTIDVSSDDTGEGTAAPASLTFTPANWNADQIVTVTGVDDELADGNQHFRIVLSAASSSDPAYDGVVPADVTTTNIDNDSAGITPPSISSFTTEDGGSATFAVKLNSQPVAEVTIGISSSNLAEGIVSPSTLIFTEQNWNAGQEVVVTGVDDDMVDGNQDYTVILSVASSTDPGYDGLDPADNPVTNIDNDSAGFAIGSISGSTTEDGDMAAFTVKLNSQPTADVTVDVSSSDTGEGTVSPASLTFTPANWNAYQTVMATGVDDDLADGNQSFSITLAAATSSDAGYDGLDPTDVTLVNTDNESAGFTFGPLGGNTTEAGGTTAFTVKLNSQPTGDVTVDVSSFDTGEGTVSPVSLTFTPANWNAYQTVTATGVDDDLADGNQSFAIILAAAVSTDTDYNGLDPMDVTAVNTDDDSAGVTLGSLSGNTTEAGGTADFSVKLNSQPTSDVTIDVSSLDTGEGTVAPASLTFTPANWNAYQTVAVTGVDDDLADGNQSFAVALAAATSTDTDYDGLDPADVTVVNTDNDSAGFVVDLISGNTTEEGDTATIAVKLNTRPTADVTVDVASSNVGEGTVSPANLTFTSVNWNVYQTVTVTGIDDGLADGNQSFTIALGAATSADAGYDGLDPADVTVVNTDNDSAGFTIGPVSGNTTEAADTATFTIKLNCMPTDDVTINIGSSDVGEGTVSPTSLTFTSANWNADWIVTVIGVDDGLTDGNQSFTVALAAATSTGSDYNGLDPADVSVVNVDNDSAGVSVGLISGNTTEAGGTATFTVKLNSQPTADVTIGFASSDSGEGTVSPSSLTFSDQNWNVDASVTVTGQNDVFADGSRSFSIILAPVDSVDTNYNGLDPADVSVVNIDDESAGITVGLISGNTTETGGAATFTVKLNSRPAADVVIAVGSSDVGEGVASPSSLTFNDQNWNADQIVTVAGIDDNLGDGNQSFTITLAAATSTDTQYDGLDPTDVTVVNADDELATITVGLISGNTTEAGGSATFSVKLNSQPTADVEIDVASSNIGEGTVTPATLTFTDQDWNTGQTVTITGANDDFADGNQSFSILLAAATSTDTDYIGLDPTDVTVVNIDDDSIGITVGSISGNTTEVGGTATFGVRLHSQPTNDVTIDVASSDTGEGTVSPATLTFTGPNWNVDQTVTVTGVNDDFADENQSFTIILAAATSADPDYNGLDPADVTVVNTDDDSAGATVGPISGNTTEVGGTAAFTVRLNSEPTADVNIAIASGDTGEGIVSPANLPFTAANWNVNQTVTVAGVDDDLADGNQSFTIALAAATSTDPDYNGLDPTDVTVVNTDDDSTGTTVGSISGNTTEVGGTATFAVRLNSEPAANVDIAIASSDTGEGTVSPTDLTFTPINWNADRTVTVAGIDDDLADGNQSFSITLSPATSTDIDYNGLDPADVTVVNTDDESAGTTVDSISGNTPEIGGTATFAVRLNSEPAADVEIAVDSSDTGEGTVSPTDLTFTPANWDADQTVTVTGIDDDLADGNQSFTITLAAATSADSDYDGIDPADVTVVNTDDDSAGATVGSTSGNTTEVGGTTTFSVRLNSEPEADVAIAVASSDTGEGTVPPPDLTVTPANWNADRTVTVTGVDDDLADGNQSFTIALAPATSTDANYDGLNPADVTVVNTDDDSAGTTVGSISGNTTEVGGTAAFTVKLNSEPADDVNIAVASSDTGEGTVSPPGLTFTPINWNADRTVTVAGVDDDLADGNQSFTITLAAATSADTDYNGLDPADVTVVNTDDESAGTTVGSISGNTTEAGGTATFTVKLNSEPTANVAIAIASSDTGEGTVSPPDLTFTPANWNADRTVTVAGIGDDLADGNQSFTITLAPAASIDTDYNGLDPADVTVVNTDDDSAGTTVDSISGNTSEAGGTAIFTVRLNSEPEADVDIAVASSDTGEGTVSPAILTFTSANWNANRVVTVTGIDDDLADGNQSFAITLAAAGSTDTDYDGLDPADVTVINIDNDSAGTTVDSISGNISETGDTATFTVRLNSQPTADVHIAVASSNTGEGTVSSSSLTFTDQNWNADQTVTVAGVDDNLIDGNQSFTVNLEAATSTDTEYNGLDPTDVTVINTDDDSAGATVGSISGNTTEAGGTATFTVRLNSQPAADVGIAVAGSDTGEGTVSPAILTFTSANWNADQTVTATGIDDDLADGNQSFTITLAPATSADAGYNGLDPADFTVINTDDDTAGVTVGSISGNTTEAGGTATFTVKLNSEPTANVVIAVTSSNTGEGTVSPADLTFTSLNWNADQTVTIDGIGDDLADGNQSFTIALAAATSADTDYNGLDPTDVTVVNTDDDSAGATVGSISGDTTETGGTATFTVRLNSEPTDAVAIAVASGDTGEGTVSPSDLTYTSANWNADQTVTATGINDDLADGNQSFTIALAAATSADSNYNGLDPADVTVVNTDDDSAGATVGSISGNTNEAGGTATFSVRLNSQPAADVVVAVTSGDVGEGDVSPADLTFTPVNWNANQVVTASGVDDDLADGSQSFTITLAAATSTDSNYDGLDPADVTVINIDDESAGATVGSISGNTDETGGTATFTVEINSRPTADVDIAVTSSNTGEGTVSPSSLSFTDQNWNAAQTVTATGVDDGLIDGNQSFTVVLASITSLDTDYNGLDPTDVTVVNIDNNSVGVTVGSISGNTTEVGGTATFNVKLNSQPTDDVVIAVTSSNTGEGIVSPADLTFTSLNWNADQTVTVAGADDDLADGSQSFDIFLEAATSTDIGYNGLDPADVTVVNTDDDSAGATVGSISGNTTEVGGTATFTVKLNSEPVNNVVIPVVSSNVLEGIVSPADLTFTSLNWNADQTVTVDGVDDDLADGNQSFTINLTAATSIDTGYSGLDPTDVTVINVDDESAGATVGPISGNTTEAGGTATFAVRLNSEPEANVGIAVASDDTGEGTVSPSDLTFTSANWNADQTVTVDGVDDDLADGNQSFTITLAAATSTDSNYNGLDPTDVTVVNTDDESAGVTVGPISGNTSETGGTAFFTVRLNSEPANNVDIAVTSSDTGEGTVSHTDLTFTSADWNVDQTITATGADDSLIDGNQSYTIVLAAATSTDPNYDGLNPLDVALTNIDNDTAGFTVGPISNDTDEGGGTATFTVRLNTQTTATVTVPVSSSDEAEGTVSTALLTIDPVDWNVDQTVTVSGVNDWLVDGNQGYAIVLGAAGSADTDYNGIDPPNVSVTNMDNDVPGFTVGPISGNTTEDGGTAFFTVRLDSQPADDVSINVSSNDTGEGNVSDSSLTFTSGDWNVDQTITVTGEDDLAVDGDEIYTIILATASSTDTDYDGLDPADVSVTNSDND